MDVTIKIKVPSDKIKVLSSEDGTLNFDMNNFDNCTVKYLFKEINKKLKKRDKK